MVRRSKAAKPSKTKPFTPVRRFFFKLELLKAPKPLDKRTREKVSGTETLDAANTSQDSKNSWACEDFSIVSTHTVTSLVHVPRKPVRVAIQEEDTSLEAIVLTKLDDIPFCCHEDILTMSRDRLVGVAKTLNAKLPLRSQIDIDDRLTDAHIRMCIEVLVGLRPEVPAAPRAIKQHPRVGAENNEPLQLSFSPPTSPLAMRIMKRVDTQRIAKVHEKPFMLASPPRLLERLQEVDENDDDQHTFRGPRPVKKRKVLLESSGLHMRKSNADYDVDKEIIYVSPSTPIKKKTSITRRVLRSQTTKVDTQFEEQNTTENYKVDLSFVNTKPRYRSAGPNPRTRKSTTSQRVQESVERAESIFSRTGHSEESVTSICTEQAPVSAVQSEETASGGDTQMVRCMSDMNMQSIPKIENSA